MTTRRRNLMLRGLGVGLTLAVVVLDALNVLAPLERWAYDKRAALFQQFTPAPTDELVHVDIDDGALEAIGAWPWSRSILADIIDELHRAGVKAVALDILFAESQPQHDARFAESLKTAGNVLVPVSFELGDDRAASPIQDAVAQLLGHNLELSWDDASAQLRVSHPALTERDFVLARERAVRDRVTREWAAGCRSLADAKRRLMPRSFDGSGTSLARVVESSWRDAEVTQTLARFGRPIPEGVGRIAHAAMMRPLVPELATSSSLGGYVDLLKSKDDQGVVRSVPLWIEHNGRLYPQMGLSLACAAMGIDPASIELRADGMTISRRGQPGLFVPLRAVRSDKSGTVGMFFDVPWFGGADWQHMYDAGDSPQTSVARHVPVTLAWAIADGRKKVVRNNELADEALRFVQEKFGYAESAKSFLAKPTPSDECDVRGTTVRAALAELDPFMQAFDGVKPEELKDDERELLNAIDVLRTSDRQNTEILRTLPRKIEDLRGMLFGKSVFLGWTATGRTDMYPTPLHNACPGVVVHGAIFNGLLTGEFLRKAPFWVTACITLGIGLLTTLIVGWLEPWKALMLTGLLVFSYLGLNGATLYDFGNWIVGVAGPVVAGGAVWSGLTLVRFIGEAKEKSRITRRFGSYADPNLVRFIVDHPELGHLEGRVEELTVVFTDLAGFTTLTEKLREKAVPILSDYMSRMVPVIQEHRGLVNKFLGDGIMFFYGAPVPNANHAADAVRTVMEMASVLEQFNRELAAAGNPTVAMRAGISTGPMVVGDAGSALRSDYTVLGDAVNLGARLESANKAVGTKTLLSGRTVELLGNQFLVRPIGKLRVAGKTEGVMTFEPVSLASEATDAQSQLAAATKEMVDAYLAGEFTQCANAAKSIEERFGESKLTHLYRDLSTEYATNRPADFDGVITLKEK